MNDLHVVLPGNIDDPATPSGGNTYDRRLCQGLAAQGWAVREHPVPGAWPHRDDPARDALTRTLLAVPDDGLVLLDGLVASAVPDVLEPQADRLRLVVLVHMPLGDDPAAEGAERDALGLARAVLTTSAWTRRRLLDRYGLPAERVHVATPGVDPAAVTPGTGAGTRLLCVAAVAPHKGHDVLVDALIAVSDLPWRCVCVGGLHRDPEFVERLRARITAHGLADRLRLAGPLTGDRLAAAYATADLLVHPSRGETYGMVVTEALARAVPVLASSTSGLPEALGRAPDGSRPGLLAPPGDPAALAGALRRWLTEPHLRDRLRSAARGRRTLLTGWTVTAARVSDVLHEVVGAGHLINT